MNAPNGSEGTRDALLLASPVPERSNVESAPLETEDGQRLTGRVCSHFCIIENDRSEEVDMHESAPPQDCPGWPPAEPPEHGRGWPPTSLPHPISHVSEADSESCRTDQYSMAPTDSQQHQ